MNVLYLLIFVSMGVAFFFLIAFIWAVRNGQFDDDYSPAIRILFEDEKVTDSDKNEDPVNIDK